MKITCSECATSFDVPNAMLAEPRRVRCSTCGHVWIPEPKVEDPSAGNFGSFRTMDDDMRIDPIPASVHPADDRDDDDHDRGRGFFTDIKWAALGKMMGGFALGMILVGCMTYSLGAMNMMPGFLKPLASIFGASTGDDMSGLSLQDITAIAGEKTTTVTGKISNNADAPRKTPTVEITQMTADGNEGDAIQVKADMQSLDAGAVASFTAELESALEPGSNLRVRLLGD